MHTFLLQYKVKKDLKLHLDRATKWALLYLQISFKNDFPGSKCNLRSLLTLYCSKNVCMKYRSQKYMFCITT